MKLEVKSTPVLTSGLQTQGEFRIKNSAKAFSILSSGLYSNKYQAILRELGCNAYDSHVAAGKADVPFTVHLPTRLNPTLSIRDYGVGLDNDGVINIYTTYFESTKQDSNDFVGCMGLGSKSPFSYTTNFSVTAIKDGMKRVYSAFIGDQGIPNIARLTEEKTTEGNGVEVSFPVERDDVRYFEREARGVFKWFKVTPTFEGVDLTVEKQEYSQENIVPGVHILKPESSWSRPDSVAVMGNVAYPINAKNANLSKELENVYDNLGVAIEFEIGELDIAASREELSYVPLTKKTLERKGEEILAGLVVYLEEKLKTKKSPWERGVLFNELMATNADFFRPAIIRWIQDNPKKVDSMSKIGYTDYKAGIEYPTLIKKFPDLRFVSNQIHHISSRNGDGLRMSNNGAQYFENTSGCLVWCPAETYVVLHDGVGDANRRIKAAYNAKMFPKMRGMEFVVIKPTDKKADPEAAFKKALKMLGRPHASQVFRTSDMPGNVKGAAGKIERQIGVLNFEQRDNGRYGSRMWTLVKAEDDFADLEPSVDTTFLYVPLMNKTIVGENHSYSAEGFVETYKDVVQELCGFNLTDHLYGVLKTSTKAIQEKTDWKNFFDYIEAKFDKLDWNKLRNAALLVENRSQIIDLVDFTNVSVKALENYVAVSPNTSFGQLATMYLECRDAKKNDAAMRTAVSRFNNILASMRKLFPKKNFDKYSLDSNEVAVEKLVDKIKTKYPMLSVVKLGNDYYNRIGKDKWQLMIDYVKMIDNR